MQSSLFLVLGLGVSPVRSGLLGAFSMGPQKCGFGPVRSQWPTQTPPRPRRPLLACVKSKSSFGMSAAAFPLQLCFLPLHLVSLAQTEL